MQHHSDYFHFKKYKTSIFFQLWQPETETELVLVIIHGIGEHSSRYHHIAEKFTKNKIKVFSIDLPGHGNSSGKRAYIKSYDFFIEIIDSQVKYIKSEHPDIPVIILGHSMGGSLAVYYALKMQPDVNGFILSSPALHSNPDIKPILLKLSGFVSTLLPWLPILQLDSQYISHDQNIVTNYNSDPLVYHGKLPARTCSEINKSIKFNQSNAEQFEYPVFIIHGSGDKLTDCQGSQQFYDNISSLDKNIKIYDGLYHELMNEFEKNEIIDDLLNWVMKFQNV